MMLLHIIKRQNNDVVERLLLDLLPLQKERGVEAHILLLDGRRTPLYDRFEEAGIRVITSPTGNSRRHIMALRRIMQDYDIIHTHDSTSRLLATAASVGRPVIHITSVHDISARSTNRRILSPLARLSFRGCAAVICASENMESKLRPHIGEGTRLLTIYDGFATGSSALKDEAEGLNLKRKPESDSVLLTMIAPFNRLTDQDSLIWALSLLPTRFNLLLVGSGKRLNECRELVSALRLTDRVTFVSECSDPRTLMQASDINVLSTSGECFSLSVVDGLTAGRPFVATDTDGVRDLAGDGTILVAPRNPQSLAEAITRLTTDREYADAIVRKATERAAAFTPDRMADGYVELYKSLLRELDTLGSRQ